MALLVARFCLAHIKIQGMVTDGCFLAGLCVARQQPLVILLATIFTAVGYAGVHAHTHILNMLAP